VLQNEKASFFRKWDQALKPTQSKQTLTIVPATAETTPYSGCRLPMNKPVFRVVGLDHATCDDAYCGTETTTKPTSMDALGVRLYSPEPTECIDTVTVRIRDIMQVLQQSATNRLSWVQDFADDPVVITRDLYDVLLTYDRLRRAS